LWRPAGLDQALATTVFTEPVLTGGGFDIIVALGRAAASIDLVARATCLTAPPGRSGLDPSTRKTRQRLALIPIAYLSSSETSRLGRSIERNLLHCSVDGATN
jgi:hypothetical protein